MVATIDAAEAPPVVEPVAPPAAEPSLIRQSIESFVQWLGFATPAEDSVPASQILFEVTPSLLGALLVGVLAYLAIHRNQMRYARDSRRIERARLLSDLDRDYVRLMATRAVHIGKPTGDPNHQRPWNLEYVLTSAFPWDASHWDDQGKRRVDWINQARFAAIGQSDGTTAWLDTLTLHQVLGWFKRIDRGLEAGILHPDTVTDLWRNILPWAKANRFNYLNSMFGPSPGGRDEPAGGPADPSGTAISASGARPVASAARVRTRPLRRPAKPRPGRAVMPDLPLDVRPVFRVIDTVLERAAATRRPEVADYIAEGLDKPLAEAFGLAAWTARATARDAPPAASMPEPAAA
ncbi:MAG: hypothetical protein ACK4Z0_03525 [Sphingomonadaceae bacterium]